MIFNLKIANFYQINHSEKSKTSITNERDDLHLWEKRKERDKKEKEIFE